MTVNMLRRWRASVSPTFVCQIKGANADEFHRVTGAQRSSYELPFVALQNLMDAGVSCNACLMASFSTKKSIQILSKGYLRYVPAYLSR